MKGSPKRPKSVKHRNPRLMLKVVGTGWISSSCRPRQVPDKMHHLETMDHLGSSVKVGKKRKHKPFDPIYPPR